VPGYRKQVAGVITGGLYTESTVVYDHSVADWYALLSEQGLGLDDARPLDALYRIPLDPG
jgi:hypothetical protein